MVVLSLKWVALITLVNLPLCYSQFQPFIQFGTLTDKKVEQMIEECRIQCSDNYYVCKIEQCEGTDMTQQEDEKYGACHNACTINYHKCYKACADLGGFGQNAGRATISPAERRHYHHTIDINSLIKVGGHQQLFISAPPPRTFVGFS